MSRLNPSSNMFVPMNTRYAYPGLPPMSAPHQMFNNYQFAGFHNIQQQPLHNQMHIQQQQQQQQQQHIPHFNPQTLHSIHNININSLNNHNANINNPNNPNHISNINKEINKDNVNNKDSINNTGINNINNNNSNSNINNTTKESNIPKTNTQYTNFEIKNLDLASRYFSECSTKDFIGNKKRTSSVAWNSNGTKIASGGVDGIIRIWNFDNSATNNKNNNSPLIELKGHDGSIDKISWNKKTGSNSNANDLLASTGSDKTIKIWDIKSAKCISTIATSSENIDVRWSPDSSFLTACTNDDYLALIDMSTMKILKNYKFNGEELNQVCWDNTGELMFMANTLGNIEVYKFLPKSTTHVKHLKQLFGHTSAIYSMEFDPTGKYFAAGSADSIISLWDIEDMMCIKTFTGFKNSFPCRTISFSFDGQFIASASYESVIDIYHVESGQQVYSIECSGVASLAWHPTLPLLAYAPEINEINKDPSIKVFGYHS